MIRMLIGYIRNSFNSMCTSVQNSECKCICLGYSQGAEYLGSKVRQLWLNLPFIILIKGLPLQLNVKESTCQCKRHEFDPWVWKIPWKRKWQPTPVFLPGKSHGQRSLMGYSPWSCKRVGHDLVTKQQQKHLLNV